MRNSLEEKTPDVRHMDYYFTNIPETAELQGWSFPPRENCSGGFMSLLF